MSHDLIATARRLAKASPKRPRQSDLKRGVSTAYYALFHALARDCADLLVGTGETRSEPAWAQVYRTLEHGVAKNSCKAAAGRGFPGSIVSFADTFVILQEERHRADYDPLARYVRAEVLVLIDNCEQAIRDLASAPRSDRKAFAVWVLFQKKGSRFPGLERSLRLPARQFLQAHRVHRRHNARISNGTASAVIATKPSAMAAFTWPNRPDYIRTADYWDFSAIDVARSGDTVFPS